jgi:xanthine dehydrogenase small subunit
MAETQDFLYFVLNGKPIQVQGDRAFQSLADFVRRETGHTGTKIACGQGACGACTVLLGRPTEAGFHYAPVNSCLQRVFQAHGCHVVTVEGVHGPNPGRDPELTPIQQAMFEHHGAQCGFCTPGIVMSLTAHGECEANPLDRCGTQKVLCGNLCRCTGYAPILEAAENIDWSRHHKLAELYPKAPLAAQLQAHTTRSALLEMPALGGRGRHLAFVPETLEAALAWRAEHPESNVISGGTEFGEVREPVEAPLHWISLGRVRELQRIGAEGDCVFLGANANWTAVQAAIGEHIPEFAALLERWGSPQLRNAGTVGGSIMRASAISDAIPCFLACEAEVELQSAARSRRLPLDNFLGADGPTLLPGELLVRVWVPMPKLSGACLQLHKISRRAAFDRSVVNAAFWWQPGGHIRLAFGGAGERVLRLRATEAYLSSLGASELGVTGTWRRAAEIAQTEIDPPTDGSSGSIYRRHLVSNLLLKWGQETFSKPEVAACQP